MGKLNGYIIYRKIKIYYTKMWKNLAMLTVLLTVVWKKIEGRNFTRKFMNKC